MLKNEYISPKFRQFMRYDSLNPHVYKLFVGFAEQAKTGNHENLGARAIMEQIRWYTQIITKGDTFKINNNHAAYYARMLMLTDPKNFKGFFRKRKLRYPTSDEAMLAYYRIRSLL